MPEAVKAGQLPWQHQAPHERLPWQHQAHHERVQAFASLRAKWTRKEKKRKEKKRKEKKRKDYTFRRQFNEKPSIIPGCPGKMDIHTHPHLMN